MIVNVHTSDNRTVFQFASRKDMVKVLPRDHDEPEKVAEPRVQAWVKWTPESDWRSVRVRAIRRGAINYVVSAEDEAESDADLPAKDLAEERRVAWEAKQDAPAGTAA